MKAFSETPIPLSAFVNIRNKGEFELKMENINEVTVNFLLFASGMTGRSLCRANRFNVDYGRLI